MIISKNNKNLTVGTNTYQQIKKDIIFGKLSPGYKLKLEGLKKKYLASFSTLREILNRLTSEGFVSTEEQRGFFVTPISNNDMIEIAQLRCLLECSALKTSVENGDTNWEANLIAAHHRLHISENAMYSGDMSQKETWKRYDWEFHLALIQACNSQNLLNLHAIIYDKYLRYQMIVLTYRGEEAAIEHRQILQAALDHNAEKANFLLETHIQKGLDHTLQQLRSK